MSSVAMQNIKKHPSYQPRRWLLAAVAALELGMRGASADTYTYAGPQSGAGADWNNPNNWSDTSNGNASGLPGSNDAANIIGGSSVILGHIIVYNPSVSLDTSPIINSLTVDFASLTQATDTTITTSSNEYVDVGGVYTQTDIGTENMAGQLTIGSGDAGTYTLGSGTLAVTGAEIVGGSGQGTFNQTGGAHTVGNGLAIGDNAGGSGIYNLSAGSLIDGPVEEHVGSYGSGIFDQTGGTHTVNNNLLLAVFGASTGQYTLSNAASLTVNGLEFVGYAGTGGATFTQSGGTHQVNNDLIVGFDGSGVYNLSSETGSSVLNVVGNVYLGGNAGAGGTLAQTGGAVNVTGISDALYVGNNGVGSYSLSGGALTAFNYIGYNGTGTFNQSGGTNQGGLEIGYNSTGNGSYSLSGTGVLTEGGVPVGYSGKGTFDQSGGTFTCSAHLVLGENAGSSGTYNLSGGQLTTEDIGIDVGLDGSGTFNQTGGTNTFAGLAELTIVENSDATGIYNLMAGTINCSGSATGEAVGNGENSLGRAVFNQTGGINSLTRGDGISIGTLNDSNALYALSGGTLISINTFNDASIVQTGGTSTLGPVIGTGTITVGGGTPAAMTATQLQQGSVTVTSAGTLTLTAGASANAVNSLVVKNGGILNMTTTELLISYGTNPDPIASILGDLASGFNSGAWTGAGINSSAAAVTHGYGVGCADSAFGSVVGLSSGQIEIKYTLYGDLNLDGEVNGTDFSILAAHFGQSATGGWEEGDLNYDGSVNGTDFALLAANFGKSATGTTIALPASEWAALDEFAAAHGLLADVPEPSAAGATSFGFACLLAKRAKKRIPQPSCASVQGSKAGLEQHLQ